MKTAMLIVIFLSAITGAGTLAFVVIEYIIEKTRRTEPEAVAVVSEPTAVFVSVPVMTQKEADKEIQEHIVEHIDAEEADEMISDEVALTAAIEEKGAGAGYRTYINLGDIDKKFERNAVVTLEALKEKGMVEKRAKRIKILADGAVTKPLTVKAESFSIQAIKMIELTGGTVIILK